MVRHPSPRTAEAITPTTRAVRTLGRCNLARLDVQVRQAMRDDLTTVSAILTEAAEWLERRGIPLWRGTELSPERLRSEVLAGAYFLACAGGDPVGTIRYQDQDPEFWPEMTGPDAAYVHRIAVKRDVAGRGVSTALLDWAVERARAEGRRYVRLDTESNRPRLRALYERYGFRYHSERQVGPYHVARYQLALRAR